MGRIRNLRTAQDPGSDIALRLRRLHLQAGEPSMRALARSTALSHDTVHRVLTGPALPRWGPLELVVEALHGDVEAFRELWVAARSAMNDEHG